MNRANKREKTNIQTIDTARLLEKFRLPLSGKTLLQVSGRRREPFDG
jgi:hypothetical protein